MTLYRCKECLDEFDSPGAFAHHLDTTACIAERAEVVA